MATDQTPETDLPAFARGGYGKLDDEIKFKLPFEHRNKVRQIAYSLNMNESEFMRELVAVRVEGFDHHTSLAEARARAVAGPGASRPTFSAHSGDAQ